MYHEALFMFQRHGGLPEHESVGPGGTAIEPDLTYGMEQEVEGWEETMKSRESAVSHAVAQWT